MIYLLGFLIGIAVIAGLIKMIIKKGVSLAARIITIFFIIGFSAETAAIPYMAYKEFTKRIDVEKIIKEHKPGFSFYLNGEKIDPSKVDVSNYNVSVDTKAGTITLQDKKISVKEAAEEFADTIGGFIFEK